MHPSWTCATVLAVTSWLSTLTGQGSLTEKVEAALAKQDRGEAIRTLKSLGPKVVDELLEIASRARDNIPDVIGVYTPPPDYSAHLLYSSAQPRERTDEEPLPTPPDRSTSRLAGFFTLFAIHDDQDWAAEREASIRAADMIGELDAWSTDRLDKIGEALNHAAWAVAQQLCASVGNLGEPGVRLLLSMDSRTDLALRGLARAGVTATRPILHKLHAESVRPGASPWIAETLWLLVERHATADVDRLLDSSIREWTNRGSFATRMCLARMLARRWKDEPQRFVAALSTANAKGRVTLVDAMIRVDGGLSANTAIALLAMLRDGDREYAPGMLARSALRSGSSDSLAALGEALVDAIPGQPLATTLGLLELAGQMGRHAEPLRPWLMTYRGPAPTRLARRIDSVLTTLGNDMTALPSEAHPGLRNAWLESERRIADQNQRVGEYSRWRKRLADPSTRDGALAELSIDDIDWSRFLARELTASYSLPRHAAVDLWPDLPSKTIDHATAKRWLEESRMLPQDAAKVHRAFERLPAQQDEDDSRRRLPCVALERVVAEKRWSADWDPSMFVALFDADDKELREFGLKLVHRFAKSDACVARVDRLSFPQRSPDLMLAIAESLAAHQKALRSTMIGDDDIARRNAYLAMIAGKRMQPRQTCKSFQVIAALGDRDEILALLAAELIEGLPEDHPLVHSDFDAKAWSRFLRLIDRERPAVTARMFLAAAHGPVPATVHMPTPDWIFEHPLTRAAALLYAEHLGADAKPLEPKLRALRDAERTRATPDRALLEDLAPILEKLSGIK